jgi:hypothetical protein
MLVEVPLMPARWSAAAVLVFISYIIEPQQDSKLYKLNHEIGWKTFA